ncbi:MAG: FlgD immunoglobulin-like domain containing protein [bacterium]|nr:FlgD immunoglobulin-like domain containing protein [bacterium]
MKKVFSSLVVASIMVLAGNIWGQTFQRVLGWRSAETYTIGPIGDVNGDGYDDIIINNPYASLDFPMSIYFGGSMIDTIPDAGLTGDGSGGFYSCTWGDFNGDSVSDFIMEDNHIAKLYFGSSVVDTIPDSKFRRDGDASFGNYMSSLHNFNGDKYEDIIIGDNDSSYIYFGGNPIDTISDLRIPGLPAREGADINGDGYCDALIKRGDTVFVYYGGTSPDNIPDWYFTTSNISDFAKAGDVNKDGYEDVIIGSKSAGIYGKAYIFYGGNPPATHNTPDITFNGASPDSNFGEHVAYAGDVNGDTFADVLITEKTGAYNSGRGKAYLYYGGDSMDTQSDWQTENSAKYSWIQFISTAGDMNNDGYSEFIIARPIYCQTPLITSFAEVWTGHSVGTEEPLNIKNPSTTLRASPNPFVQTTVISGSASGGSADSKTKIQIYDVSGKLVRILALNKDNGAITWNGKDNNGKNVPDGTYFCRLNTSTGTKEVKVTKATKVTSTGRMQ